MIVNGESIDLLEEISVTEFLLQNHYNIHRIAIELNGLILPKSSYDTTILKHGDRMEIVTFMGGG